MIEHKFVYGIIDFEHHQVFDTATTYTCLLLLDKSDKSAFDFSQVNPPEILSNTKEFLTKKYIDAKDKTWLLTNSSVSQLLQKMNEGSTKLIDLPCAISRGSSTGDDKVFILRRHGARFINGYDEEVDLDEELLVEPIFATDFTRYQFKGNNGLALIFPYGSEDESFQLISEEYLSQKYPKTYDYLAANIERLSKRKQFSKWYAYSAARNLKLHGNADIIIPLLANKGLFSEMPKDKRYTLMAGGGFSISIQTPKVSTEYLLALLNSRLLFFQLYRESNKFRGGYITCTKQYFETLPIKIINHDEQLSFKILVDKIGLEILKGNNIEVKKLESEIDQLVYALYSLTEEEIKLIESS